MTRKPVPRKSAILGRVMLGWAVMWIVYQLVTDRRPYDWTDAVGLALGATVVVTCIVQEVQYRRDRRDGRV